MDFASSHVVAPSLRGRGIANELARMGLEYAKEHRLKVSIVVLSSSTPRKHPEYKSLVGIRGYQLVPFLKGGQACGGESQWLSSELLTDEKPATRVRVSSEDKRIAHVAISAHGGRRT